MSGQSAPARPVHPDDPARATPRSRPRYGPRYVLLAIGAAALLTGLWGGLARIGLALPGGTLDAVALHGALMVSGFLGTLISLERAVALGRSWAYAAPVASALGAVLLLVGEPGIAAAAFLLAGACLTADSIVILRRQPALFTCTLTLAAACWAGGTLVWMTKESMPDAVGWWIGFLVLTIAAERLELSRLLAPGRMSQAAFVVAAALVLVGIARAELAGPAAPFAGVGLLTMTAWLLTHDIAPRMVHRAGLPRFSAACMLAGYVWLAVAGAVLLAVPPGAAAFSYDAAVHAITIGFVLSMIFAHAPIILPAVAGLPVRYSAAAYVPLGLLHVSAGLRIGADLFDWVEARPASAILTVLALAGYAAVIVFASLSRRNG
jgi:hypothetical protein